VAGPTRPVIEARQVNKKFVVHRSRATSLKELALRRGQSNETLWALRDISMDIGRGETVGLIGANGSGKSTLLKVLAGILQPTSGTVTVRGRITSLLELGAGFNGELSGRDNVYLNGALLGLSRREVDRLFDAIVEFSELEQFIDNMVKHYSSGMYVRLAFAVAVHVDPDILLVDEVLAVGDEHFQQKCLAKMAEFQEEQRTILFVSHALDLVESICGRAVVLHHGDAVFDGDPAYATGTLRGILGTGTAPAPAAPESDLSLTGITISRYSGGGSVSAFRPGDPFVLRVEVDIPTAESARALDVVAVAVGAGEFPIWAMSTDGDGIPAAPGRWFVDFTVPALPPVSGGFVIAVRLDDPTTGVPVAAYRFPRQYFTVTGDHAAGLIGVPYEYRVRPVEEATG